MIEEAAAAAGVTNVVDAWGIDGLERYASVPRLGRRARWSGTSRGVLRLTHSSKFAAGPAAGGADGARALGTALQGSERSGDQPTPGAARARRYRASARRRASDRRRPRPPGASARPRSSPSRRRRRRQYPFLASILQPSARTAPCLAQVPEPQRRTRRRKQPKRVSLDDLVGAGEDRWRDLDADLSRHLAVEDQLELVGC
jgi:hypothetical protein